MENRRVCYTKKSFLESFGISAATFYRWTKLPGFPVVRTGSKILIPAKEVEEWLSANIGKNVLPGGTNGKAV